MEMMSNTMYMINHGGMQTLLVLTYIDPAKTLIKTIMVEILKKLLTQIGI